MAEPAHRELLQQAVEHRHRGELDTARRVCKQVLSEDETNAEARYVLATVEGQAGNLAESETQIRQAILSQPEQALFHACLGKTLSLKGHLDAADAAYQKALALDPELAVSHNGLGEVMGQRGDLEKARAAFILAIDKDPDLAAAHKNLGTCLVQMGDRAGSIDSFKKAIELNSSDAGAWHSLAAVYNLGGHTDQAVECLKRVLEFDPRDVKALNNLATTFMNRNDLRQAYAYLMKVIKLAPEYAAPFNNIGKILHAMCRFDRAEASFLRAIDLKPDFPDAYANLGFVYQSQGKLDEARKAHEHALELVSDHPIALSGLASLCEIKGQYEEGLEYLGPVIQRPEMDASCVVSYAQLIRGLDRQKEAIAALTKRLEQKPLSHDGKVQIMFALGDLYDDLGKYDLAFDNYQKGNDAKGVGFDTAEFAAIVDNILAAFSADAIGKLPRSTNDSSRPLFILGMPRAGKSLLEQIVASHPAVYGAGELDILGRLAMHAGAASGVDMPYPACVDRMTSAGLDKLASEYLSELDHAEEGIRYVTDTMPMNFMHIGLIELMLPNARILHCRRNAMDTAISCYAKNFLDPTLAFTYKLKDLKAYMEQYGRFMAQWKDVVNLKILEVDYESLVANTDTEVRRIIDFLELEWSDVCLRFFEESIPTTASAKMIRKPLHDKEIGRHKYYEEYIGPIFS